MSSPAPATVSVRNVFRRFRRNRQGSAAVEFALVAPLFFGMLFAIIETAIVFFAGQLLEQGTAESARLMLTHQAQDSGMNETAFKTDLCNRIKVMFNCYGNLGNITVDVKVFAPGDLDHDYRSDRQWKPDRSFRIFPAAIWLSQYRRRSRLLSMAAIRDAVRIQHFKSQRQPAAACRDRRFPCRAVIR